MRVGIVNDLSLAVEALRRVVEQSGRHEVAWIARSGREAVEHCRAVRPDVVLMDLNMPGMGGVETIREIMRSNPCPILVVTASVTDHAGLVFQALGAGALDAVDTPVLSAAKPGRGAGRLLAKLDAMAPANGHRPSRAAKSLVRRPASATPVSPTALVAIGSSAGGPAAVSTLLRGLPEGLPAALVIVQHIDAAFAPLMATWLNEQSPIPVRLAETGDVPVSGTALLAGTNDHLILDATGKLAYSPYPREGSYRPSVDVFFESVAAHWNGRCLGVILSGMGRDGARGLRRLRETGAYTLAQDQSTSAVYGMPKAAAELDAACRVLPLDAIAPELANRLLSLQNQ